MPTTKKKRGRPPKPIIKVKDDPLTPREEITIKAYTNPDSDETFLNKTRSYMAGYRVDYESANKNASVVFARPRVKQSLREILEETDIRWHIQQGLEKFCREGKDATDWKDKKVAMEAFKLYGDFTGGKDNKTDIDLGMTEEGRKAKRKELLDMVRKTQAGEAVPE